MSTIALQTAAATNQAQVACPALVPVPAHAPSTPITSAIANSDLVREIERVAQTHKMRRTLGGVVLACAGLLILAVIAASFFFGVMQVRGASMEPTVREGDILISSHTAQIAQGDVVAIDYYNRALVKRVVAFPGDVVDIDDYGTVAVNGNVLREEYAQDLVLGDSDVEFPCVVPDNSYFVLGDNRGASIDSRSSAVGMVKSNQVIGKVVLRVWPVNTIGFIS